MSSLPQTNPERERLGRTVGAIYFSGPLSTYETQRYAEMLAYLRGHYPDAEILEPKHLFHSHAQWKVEWPELLSRIDAVVFFHDNDPDCIGHGVWAEINDAASADKRVEFLSDDGQLISPERLKFDAATPQSMRQFVHVRTAGDETDAP
jgi:hypothetical protein